MRILPHPGYSHALAVENYFVPSVLLDEAVSCWIWWNIPCTFWTLALLVLAHMLFSVMPPHIVRVRVHLAASWAFALVVLAQVLYLVMPLDSRLAREHLAAFRALGLTLVF